MLSHRGCPILIKERTMENFRTSLKRRTNQRVLLLSLTAFLVALGIYLLQPRPITAQDQQVQVVELKAKKYEYVPSPVHLKAGTKVQLKITAVDHDHGFKITTVPNGAEKSGKPGLVLASPQDCWQLKREKQPQLNFSHKRPARTRFG